MHKSVAIKLVHNMTSPKWKDGDNEEVVTLDEEGFVEAEIRLGAFPGHQKVSPTRIISKSLKAISRKNVSAIKFF